jgi:beta-lactamase class A
VVPSTTSGPQHRDPFGSADRTDGLLAAVYDITTGQEWSLGQGKPQAEASIVKLDILQTLLARHGLNASLRPTALRMMEASDNTAATSLWFAAGGPDGIGRYNAQAGLQGTSLSRCVNCPGFPWPGWGLTTTTPGDQIALLRQLVPSAGTHRLLAQAQRQYVLGLMENVVPAQRWGVSGGVPAGVTTALKNGWLPLNTAATDWQINSVGWIDGDGRDYLIAVLTTGNPSMHAGITRINALSATIYHAMG